MQTLLKSLVIPLVTALPLLSLANQQTPPQEHWAFRELSSPALPLTKQTSWPANNIDRFILHKIEASGLSPGEKAKPEALIRRLYYALVGLPPSYGETQFFKDNFSKHTYSELVDKLLSSPHFGERWGRHWLDVARYADTKGYVFEESRDYPYAYTYRDWVIRSFNKDLPYNRFLTYQLAADTLIQEDGKKEHLAAMGFLTVGRRFLNREPDIIDDRIDVTFRGMMGLTVACARCHDHKYDPIPIDDYYSLYGVFSSSTEPNELPLLQEAPENNSTRDFRASLSKKQDQLNSYLEKRVSQQREPEYIKKYLLTATTGLNLSEDELKKLASSKKLLQKITVRWRDLLKKDNASNDPIYGPWLAFSRIPPENFPTQATNKWEEIKSSGIFIHPAITQQLNNQPLRSIETIASLYGKTLAESSEDPKLEAALSPSSVNYESIFPLLETKGQQYVRKLRRELEAIKTNHPGAPPRAMTMVDRPSPREPRVFERGDPARRGKKVPRHFLQVIKGKERSPFISGSGRQEMALDIADKDNPLTARVWVNRVWGHLLGKHLVSTPSDFGLRSEAPSHPELLDFLALQLIENNWSTKQLIRSIVLSSTYQQVAGHDPRDPEKLFYTRTMRRRLDFEAMRDSILAVSGELDRSQFGRPVKIHTSDYSHRRTVYGHVERQNLPPVFRTFDFASPDVHTAKRPQTIVPQQALYMLNGKFVRDQALALINSPEMKKLQKKDERVAHLYRQVYSRDPDHEELADAITFLNPKPVNHPWDFGFGKIDMAAGNVNFQHFTHFVSGRLQIGNKLPDPSLGYINLSKEGGHPGKGEAHCVLQWTAPHGGTYNISTNIKIPSTSSDGVILRIADRQGDVMKRWQITPGKKHKAGLMQTHLEKDEPVFLIVSAGKTDHFDSFEWEPIIRESSTGTMWEASSAFITVTNHPPESLWIQLAQALLASNEFAFLD